MKKQKKTIELSTGIAIASLLMSIISMVWIGGFQISALIHEVKDLKENVQKIENRMDKMDERIEKGFHDIQTEIHKHDIRITTIEQRKP